MNLNIYEKLTIPEKNKSISISKRAGEFIYDFLKKRKLVNTLEIGLAYGSSAAHIISSTHSKHIAIDPFQKDYDYLGIKNLKKLNLHKYLILENDFSHNVLPRFLKENKKIDFAFIDGDHKYDSIFVDFYYVDLLLSDQGFILFDDSWMRSVQLVSSFIKKIRIIGVLERLLEILFYSRKLKKTTGHGIILESFITIT